MTLETALTDTGLAPHFLPFPCDFCAGICGDHSNKLCYTDPETKWRFCLNCLELSTEVWEELPPDPATVAIGRELVYAPR